METNKLTEPMKKRLHCAALLTNLFFLVADLLETIGTECEEMNAELGLQLRRKEANHYQLAMKHIKHFRSATRGLDNETQNNFGNDAELLGDLVYAAVSRTGTDDKMMHKFLEYIMQYPDRVGLDGVRRGGDAFESIKKEQAQKRVDDYIKNNL